MATLEVRNIAKVYSQADNGDMLSVEVEISAGPEDNPEPAFIRRLGYPLATTAQELEVELKKYIDTYNADLSQAQANKELDAAHVTADNTIAEVNGKSFT